MKSVTITMPEELDQRATEEARRRGVSKSELIRRGLAAVLPPDHAHADDPWVALSGFGDPTVEVGAGDVDEVVYGS